MRTFKCSNYALPLGEKTYIMGILNVTPDSFSDGGKYYEVSSALEHAEQMAAEGADILDIGAVSTRPFSKPVSIEEEWERLKNIIPEIRKNFDIPLSVDTYNTEIAEKCLNSGADIINDVSGKFSGDMAAIVKKYNAGWIHMHGGIRITKSEAVIDYSGGIMKSVNEFFSDIIKKTEIDGIDKEYICLDPGFGFAKDVPQNSELLRNSDKLETYGCALLCALSKKRFIGNLSNCDKAEDRIAGTLAADIIAAEKGADIVRVHDVKVHKEAFDLYDKIMR